MENYLKRQDAPKPVQRNGKPEAEFLLKLRRHLKSIGWSVHIIEAKASYSEDSGRYTHGAVSSGYPDLSGNMPNGLAVYLEVKAPGKRSTIRPAQHQFLIDKINTNCFAIVCDSIEYFDSTFSKWQSTDMKKAYLLRELPELAPRYQDDLKLFD